jgi:AcrR family transcriptional regulator
MSRALERRRAVALARHYREFEGLSIRQIADRLGRSPATVKAYFYDPTGEKARAVKARYQGVCRRCGAYTQPRNGKGDAYSYCKACHPGAIERRWTRARVLEAMWARRLGTAGCRRRTIGRARTRAGVGERRSSD